MLKIFLAVAAVTVVTLSSCTTAASEPREPGDTSAAKDSTK